MPSYVIDTEELVHGRYYIEAEDAMEARQKFEAGDVGAPNLFETISVESCHVERATDDD